MGARQRSRKGKDPGEDIRPFGPVSVWAISLFVFLIVLGYGAFREGLFSNTISITQESSDSELEQAAQSVATAERAPSLRESVAQLSVRLAANPEDLEGWVLLGNSYLVMGQYEMALSSFGEAKRLDPSNADIQVSFGEVLVFANGGAVPPVAKSEFEAALENNPRHPVARYYMALSAYQEGERGLAVTMWQALLDEAPNSAPWREAVRQKLAEAGALAGSDRDSARPPSADGRSPTAAFDETASEIANAPAEEQAAMIQSMVENLAARLEDDPSDLNGWRMLARSYSVLGRSSDAEDKLLAAINSQNRGTVLRASLERLALEIYGVEVN